MVAGGVVVTKIESAGRGRDGLVIQGEHEVAKRAKGTK